MEMKTYNKYAHLKGSLVMVGLGNIRQAMLPLLFRHLELRPDRPDNFANENGENIAREFGVPSRKTSLQNKILCNHHASL